MRIDTSRGAANGIYIIWDSYLTMDDGERRDQRFYCDDNSRASGIFLEDRGKTKSVFVARIADHFTDLRRGRPFDFTEAYTRLVDIRNTVKERDGRRGHPFDSTEAYIRLVDIRYTLKKRDGTVGIYTGPGYDLPEDYFLIFPNWTDSLTFSSTRPTPDSSSNRFFLK